MPKKDKNKSISFLSFISSKPAVFFHFRSNQHDHLWSAYCWKTVFTLSRFQEVFLPYVGFGVSILSHVISFLLLSGTFRREPYLPTEVFHL